ncbi:hypothetical protein JCM11251_003783 [Rhodosporidiobolus azoricus]
MSFSLNETLAEIGYTGPVNYNPADDEAAISIYGYTPSNVLAIVALVTFGITFLINLTWLVKYRTTRTFYGLFLFGSACEMVGYGCRLRSHSNPFIVMFFVIAYFFIIVSPVFYQAGLYLAFAQSLRRLNPHDSKALLRFEPRILIWVMIVADVVTTIIQVVGAALIGVAESARFDNRSTSLTSAQANDILLAGLSIQTFTFLAFITILVLCIVRSSRTSSTTAHLPKLFSLLLLFSALLLLLRTTFRLAETAEGVFGPAASNETLFGTLEFMPVILAVSLWAIMPLEKTLPHPRTLDGREAYSEKVPSNSV